MDSRAQLDRRAFLSLALVATGAVVATSVGLPLSVARAAELPRWSDPVTWGGSVPARGARVVLDKAVLLDVDVHVGGLVIEEGGALHFDPDATRTLTSAGNVVVRGVLQMRPREGRFRHVLRFPSVDERVFVGGGMEVLDSDVGLWCVDRGSLDIAGAPKLAWARTVGSLVAGGRTVVLQADPVGWAVGDELAITPTAAPGAGHHDRYDYAVVTQLSGRTVTLSAPLVYAHPAVEIGAGMTLAPEVLNLTRNVSLEGSAGGRAHIFIMSQQPQNLSYFSARWMGPRQAEGAYTASVLGRYGVHFHMGGEGSRGSQVVGAVVRDTGGHAYVVHASHGVSLTSCISHDTFDDAYWWDGMVDTRTPGPDTNDVALLACVASRVRSDPPFRGYRLSGFVLGSGIGNRALDCVAVGVQGSRDASGFIWPEVHDNGVWDFQRCVSHNNAHHGIFTWQNTIKEHVVRDFACYHNGGSGIAHGAYLNRYHYTNGYLFGNAAAAVTLHANSRDTTAMRFSGLHCDGAGIAKHAVSLTKHTLESTVATQFASCTFQGQTGEAVAATYAPTNGATTPERVDLVNSVSTTPLLWLRDDTLTESAVRVQAGGSALVARVKSQPGTLRGEWNAVTNPIPLFAADPGVPAQPFTVLSAALPPTAVAPAPTPTEPAPTPSHQPVQMSLSSVHIGRGRGRGATHRLRVINSGSHACSVDVRLDGVLIATRPVPAGETVVVAFGSSRRTRMISASCHDSTATWRAPFTV